MSKKPDLPIPEKGKDVPSKGYNETEQRDPYRDSFMGSEEFWSWALFADLYGSNVNMAHRTRANERGC